LDERRFFFSKIKGGIPPTPKRHDPQTCGCQNQWCAADAQRMEIRRPKLGQQSVKHEFRKISCGEAGFAAIIEKI